MALNLEMKQIHEYLSIWHFAALTSGNRLHFLWSSLARLAGVSRVYKAWRASLGRKYMGRMPKD
jgi:hypothetical protein